MTTLKQLIDSESGTQLREYLQGQIDELCDLSNCPDLKSKPDMVSEVKARIRTANKFKKILSEIMSIKEIKSKIKNPKDKYHPEDL